MLRLLLFANPQFQPGFFAGDLRHAGRLIAQADHIPVMSARVAVGDARSRGAVRGPCSPGDVILLNDPYYGGSHLPDLTAFVPVFDGDKRLLWTIVRAHQAISAALPLAPIIPQPPRSSGGACGFRR